MASSLHWNEEIPETETNDRTLLLSWRIRFPVKHSADDRYVLLLDQLSVICLLGGS